MEGILWWYYR